MKIATLAYLPPSRVPFAAAFIANIREHKAEFPLLLFSDSFVGEGVEIVANPERYARGGKPWVISNYCFLKAIQVAVRHGLDWMILMEADCRINGSGWDKKMWDEFSTFNGALMGGTPVCWNLNRGSRILTMKLIAYANDYQVRAGIPMAIHGVHGGLSAARQGGHYQPCLYPNGAAAIYSVELLTRIFPNYGNDASCVSMTAWDMHIGYRMHNIFGDEMPDKVAAMASIFSGYGEEILAEHERREWLHSGRICAVHQIKDNWKP